MGYANGTALVAAASEGRESIVRLLLDRKANPSFPSSSGKSALDCARDEGHHSIVRILSDLAALPSDAVSLPERDHKPPQPAVLFQWHNSLGVKPELEFTSLRALVAASKPVPAKPTRAEEEAREAAEKWSKDASAKLAKMDAMRVERQLTASAQVFHQHQDKAEQAWAKERRAQATFLQLRLIADEMQIKERERTHKAELRALQQSKAQQKKMAALHTQLQSVQVLHAQLQHKLVAERKQMQERMQQMQQQLAVVQGQGERLPALDQVAGMSDDALQELSQVRREGAFVRFKGRPLTIFVCPGYSRADHAAWLSRVLGVKPPLKVCLLCKNGHDQRAEVTVQTVVSGKGESQ